LLSFLSVSLLVFVILSLFLSKGASLREKMKFYDAAWRAQKNSVLDLDESVEKSRGEKLKEKVLKGVDYLASQRGFTDLIQLKLEQAGLPLRPLEFIFFHFLFALLAGMAASLFTKNLVSPILLAGVATSLPILILYVLINRRRAKFHEQLPDTLTMIAGSIRAGYSFLQAISVAVDETLPPMSDEFRRVLTEARLGLPLEEALEKMAERVGEQNFTWTVMAINIQREVGGNLAEVLEILADTIRDRDRVKRQIKTLTAEGRLSALILIILPFFQAFLLFLVNPTYMSLLFTTGIGLLMVLAAIVLMLLGGLWLKKIVSIEV
jgi:tight adherence protein B